MKTLILMRHAKSDWSMNLEDHARPLNARGTRAGRALAIWLKDSGHIPDEVISSDARRTIETFELLNLDVAASFERRLYLAEAGDLLNRLSQGKGDCVMMIGHNPGIATLARSLVTEPPDHARFADYPTAATLVATFPCRTWPDIEPGTGRVADFVIPRDLE